MPGKNSGICHGCRVVGHFFGGCQIKRRYPDCEHKFQKFSWLKGTLLTKTDPSNVAVISEFWDWCEGEAIGESSNAKVSLGRPTTHTEIDDMSQTFESQVRLNNDEETVDLRERKRDRSP